MSEFFLPYEGRRPYVFVSYSHRSTEEVLKVITILHQRKLRLWYDEGIPAGSDWPKNIEQHMRSCRAVLFFISDPALQSKNCISEIETAASLGLPILTLRLDRTQLDGEWKKRMQNAIALDAPADPQARAEAVLRSPVIGRIFYRKFWEGIPLERLGLVLSSLLFAAAFALLYGTASGKFDPPVPSSVPPAPTIAPTPLPTEAPSPTPTIAPTPVPGYMESLFPVAFPDTQQEQLVRRVLGKASGDLLYSDLAGVKELHFVGNMSLLQPEGITFDRDGTCRVNKPAVITGKVSDLSVIGRMGNLTSLSLICQPAEDLSPLKDLYLLSVLDLSGCKTPDLSGLAGMPSLQELRLAHTGIRDLSPLEDLPALRTVSVSADMLPIQIPSGARFAVLLIP